MAVNWGDFKPRGGATYRYVQLADWIEAAVKSGLLQPGERLPAQRDLGEQTGTSTELAGKAMAVLRDRGVVETSKLGTFVVETPPPES
jgi:DNA-binding GntR family transcriptional regulator